MTLACKDASSKIVEAVSVADVDGEDCVDNNLSKKLKPSSSHILEIYFEKKVGFTSTFGQTC